MHSTRADEGYWLIAWCCNSRHCRDRQRCWRPNASTPRHSLTSQDGQGRRHPRYSCRCFHRNASNRPGLLRSRPGFGACWPVFASSSSAHVPDADFIEAGVGVRVARECTAADVIVGTRDIDRNAHRSDGDCSAIDVNRARWFHSTWRRGSNPLVGGKRLRGGDQITGQNSEIRLAAGAA